MMNTLTSLLYRLFVTKAFSRYYVVWLFRIISQHASELIFDVFTPLRAYECVSENNLINEMG